MRKLYLILIAFSIGTAITIYPSCTKDFLEPAVVDIPDSVSFSQYIIPIFNDNCNRSGCHSSGGIAPDLTAANAWTSLVYGGYVETDTAKAASSIIYERMTSSSKPMPPTGKLAGGEDQLILAWIKQGALDN